MSSEPTEVQPQGTVVRVTTGEVRLSQRHYASGWLIRSAQHHASDANAIEDEHRGEWGDPWVLDYLGLVISAVIVAATFLDALINELYTDALEGHGLTGEGYLAPLNDGAVIRMAEYWRENSDGRHSSTLRNYRLACRFADVGGRTRNRTSDLHRVMVAL
jgi:hypothetical protein